MPYVDPKLLNQAVLYKLNEKSDIYCLGVLFWEVTICSSSFNDFEDNHIAIKVLGEPEPNTNEIFTVLYQSLCKLILEQLLLQFLVFLMQSNFFNLFE